MDFWTYPTLYTTLRDKASPGLRDLATFHSRAMADMVAQGDPIGPKQVDAEYHWLQDSRPYYHLYPGILEPLLNLALDLDTGAIRWGGIWKCHLIIIEGILPCSGLVLADMFRKSVGGKVRWYIESRW